MTSNFSYIKRTINILLIETPNTKLYCEVKLGNLREKDFYQAKRYYNAIINNPSEHSSKEFSIILIGMAISKFLRRKAESAGILISIIGIDVPEKLKICETCRKAYDSNFDYCIHCNSAKVLEILKVKYP